MVGRRAQGNTWGNSVSANVIRSVKFADSIALGKHQFASIPVVKADGSTSMLGFDESAAIFEHLKTQGFVDANGKVQDTLRTAIKDGTLALPKALEAHQSAVRDVLKKVAGKLDIKNADERIVVKTRQAILESAEFQALWDRIKHKTTYRVHFDNEKLVVDCGKAVAGRRVQGACQDQKSRSFDRARRRRGLGTEQR